MKVAETGGANIGNIPTPTRFVVLVRTVVLRQKGWYTTDKWDYEWDKDWRPNPELEEDVGETLRPFTRHILLIRHGLFIITFNFSDRVVSLFKMQSVGNSMACPPLLCDYRPIRKRCGGERRNSGSDCSGTLSGGRNRAAS